MPVDIGKINQQLFQLVGQKRQQAYQALQAKQATMTMEATARKLEDKRTTNQALNEAYDPTTNTIDMQEAATNLADQGRAELALELQKTDVDMRKSVAQMSQLKRLDTEGEVNLVSGTLQGLRAISDPEQLKLEYASRVKGMKAKGYGRDLPDEYPGPEIVDDYLFRSASANTVFAATKAKTKPTQKEWQRIEEIASIPENERSPLQNRVYSALMNKRDWRAKIPTNVQIDQTSQVIDSVIPHFEGGAFKGTIENRGAFDVQVTTRMNEIVAESKGKVSHQNALQQAMKETSAHLVNEADLKEQGMFDSAMQWVEDKGIWGASDLAKALKSSDHVYVPNLTPEMLKTPKTTLPKGLDEQLMSFYINKYYAGKDTKENRDDVISQFNASNE